VSAIYQVVQTVYSQLLCTIAARGPHVSSRRASGRENASAGICSNSMQRIRRRTHLLCAVGFSSCVVKVVDFVSVSVKARPSPVGQAPGVQLAALLIFAACCFYGDHAFS
jgi:hypothetical protein